MSYILEGTVKFVDDTKTFGTNFTKREIVVTGSKGPDDKYPQHIKFTLIKDKVHLADSLQSGQRVKVHFDIRGNEHNGRYYVDLQAWKIEDEHGQAVQGGGAQRQTGYSGGYSSGTSRPHPQRPVPPPAAEEDHMPF